MPFGAVWHDAWDDLLFCAQWRKSSADAYSAELWPGRDGSRSVRARRPGGEGRDRRRSVPPCVGGQRSSRREAQASRCAVPDAPDGPVGVSAPVARRVLVGLRFARDHACRCRIDRIRAGASVPAREVIRRQASAASETGVCALCVVNGCLQVCCDRCRTGGRMPGAEVSGKHARADAATTHGRFASEPAQLAKFTTFLQMEQLLLVDLRPGKTGEMGKLGSLYPCGGKACRLTVSRRAVRAVARSWPGLAGSGFRGAIQRILLQRKA